MEARDRERTKRRETWAFQFKPAEVLAAAEEKVQHHANRLKWWNDEFNKAEEQLKEKGFEYRERQYSHESGVQIVGDPELAKRVADCRYKKTEHREKQELYQTWVRALKAKTERQPGEDLDLSIDDVLFFGL